MPTISTPQIKLLEKLCNAVAVSGDEGAVRKIVLEEVEPFADDVKIDALGNVLAFKNGTSRNKVRVMIDAHMDEVGFMIVGDDGDGLYRFEIVGGIDVRQLPGKAVLVGKSNTYGVIGARPIHLTTADERTRKIPLDALRVDVGAAKLNIGDRGTFATRFYRNGNTLMSKAIDDRVGVATLIELLRHAPANVDLCAAFAVQEEIGLRGAKVVAHAFNPDFAIALDATPAYDFPSHNGVENSSYNTRLGFGPAIYTFDRGTISDTRLVKFLAQVGEKNRIPFQYRQTAGGGTDAASIQRSLAGIPAVSVSVPHRHYHTAVNVAYLSDWKNTFALIYSALKAATPSLLKR